MWVTCFNSLKNLKLLDIFKKGNHLQIFNKIEFSSIKIKKRKPIKLKFNYFFLVGPPGLEPGTNTL